MKISKTHEEFAWSQYYHYHISKQEVLNHPEKYLGPNWEEVINFWLYLDTLSENQLLVVNKRYWALSIEQRIAAKEKAWNIARATTKYYCAVGSSAYCSVSYVKGAADWSTLELIGLDKLMEKDYLPVFFPLFLYL